MTVGPIHHRGDGEAAGEWGGCGGNRGHWRYWIVWGWEVGEFIRVGGEVWGAETSIGVMKPFLFDYGNRSVALRPNRLSPQSVKG